MPLNSAMGRAKGAGGGAASSLQTNSGTVAIGAAAAPSVGQILTATDNTHATWQDPSISGAVRVQVSEPPATLTAADSGKTFYCDIGDGPIPIPLPAATGNNGVYYRFVVIAASAGLVVTAGTGDTLTILGATSSAGGTLSCSTAGAHLELESFGVLGWFGRAVGTWTAA